MKKKIFAVTLAFLITFALMPTITFGATGVPYVDANGVQQTPVDTEDVVTGTSAGWDTTGGNWYSVSGPAPVIISNRIVVTGNVNLILCDGAELIASEGINVPPGSSLTIYGQSLGTGTLEATATTVGSAGIGGNASQAGGTVNIYGGTVNAQGGTSSAGIGGGGGMNGSGGTVTIYGGTVTAQGGGGGSGIGGGYNASGGTVYVYGGTVNAQGGDGGAGIGGGLNGSDGGIVNITGGTVTAQGGSGIGGNGGGAGIGGGGNSGGGGSVNISGGVIDATGGNGTATGGGAGIGGGGCTSGTMGPGGGGGTVNISGGTVTAQGGVGGFNYTNGDGIGSGGGDSSSSIGAGATGTIEKNAIVYASTLPNTGTTPGTNIVVSDAIVFLGAPGSEMGTVYGGVTLQGDLTIESGQTLNVTSGTTLTIPKGITLTKNNTAPIDNEGTIRVAGILAGSGTIGGSGVVLYQLRLLRGQITTKPIPQDQFYPQGDSVNVTADTPSALVFSNWSAIVNGANANTPLSSTTSATSTVTMPEGAVELTAYFKDAPPVDAPPNVISGFQPFDGTGSRSATIDTDLPNFSGLTLNGDPVDNSNFGAAQGSTIITLYESYLNTFGNGTYTFVAHFNNGTVNLPITIAKATSGTASSNPKTADDTPLGLLFALIAVAGAALVIRRRTQPTLK